MTRAQATSQLPPALATGAVTAADFDAWCRSSAPGASGHEVVMLGFAPLVQAQVLFGLQERCRQGALTYLFQLRVICRRLLAAGAQTITGFNDPRLARQHRALARDLQQAVLLAGASPEDEQRKDIWNTVVLGHDACTSRIVAVRDAKDWAGTVITFGSRAWARFAATAKD